MSSRSYDSSRRQKAAQKSRLELLDAARSLFVERGYAATTVADIADRAGVAPATAAAAFGGKAGLLKRLIDVGIAGDDLPVPMVERDIARQVAEESDPRRQCSLFVAAVAGAHDRLADLVDVTFQASGVDEQVRADWKRRQAARRNDMRRFVELIAPEVLAVDIDRGADIVWALTEPQLFLDLVRDRGWSVAEYEAWLVGQLERGLLTPGLAKRPSGG